MATPESSATSSLDLARDLLEAEGLSPEDPDSGARACDAVLRALYDKLRPLVGNGGYETLLGRAAVMAAREYSRLGSLPIPRAGPPSFDQLAGVLEGPDDRPAPKVAELFVAELLAFLGRLLGWALTLVVLRDLWPEVAFRYDPSELEHSSPPRPPRDEG